MLHAAPSWPRTHPGGGPRRRSRPPPVPSMSRRGAGDAQTAREVCVLRSDLVLPARAERPHPSDLRALRHRTVRGASVSAVRETSLRAARNLSRRHQPATSAPGARAGMALAFGGAAERAVDGGAVDGRVRDRGRIGFPAGAGCPAAACPLAPPMPPAPPVPLAPLVPLAPPIPLASPIPPAPLIPLAPPCPTMSPAAPAAPLVDPLPPPSHRRLRLRSRRRPPHPRDRRSVRRCPMLQPDAAIPPSTKVRKSLPPTMSLSCLSLAVPRQRDNPYCLDQIVKVRRTIVEPAAPLALPHRTKPNSLPLHHRRDAAMISPGHTIGSRQY